MLYRQLYRRHGTADRLPTTRRTETNWEGLKLIVYFVRSRRERREEAAVQTNVLFILVLLLFSIACHHITVNPDWVEAQPAAPSAL